MSLAQAALLLKVDERRRQNWKHVARPDQLPPPGDWVGWLLMCGRGWGKTRTGAETVSAYARAGFYRRFHLIAPTAGDARDVMVEGESGVMNIGPQDFRPDYEPSKRRITWPNGAIATLFSADEPLRLRGPQCEFIWADEPRSWRYPEAWDMAMLGLRLGPSPRWIATTTPNRSILIRKLMASPHVFVTRGSTYDNRANLAAAFFDQIAQQYEGTTLGRQELYAELLADIPGALWKQATIEAGRIKTEEEQKALHNEDGSWKFKRIVVAIDPAVTSSEGANETGIIVAGIDEREHGYIIADRSARTTPDGWAKIAVGAYHDFSADRIVAETNQGGEMVELTIRTADHRVPVKLVHASKGKIARAEPVAALYEQGKVHHVGMFAELEDQLCSKIPGDDSVADDRYDALVWALTELMLGNSKVEVIHQNPFYG